MKLWQKIFLSTLALVIVAVQVTALLLLYSNRRLSLERERERVAARHDYVAASLQNTVVYTRLSRGQIQLYRDEVVELTTQALQEDNTRQTGGALYREGARLTTQGSPCTAQAEQAVLAQQSGQRCWQIVRADGAVYMLTGTLLSLEGVDYQLVTWDDLTAVYQLEERQFWYGRLMSVGCAVVVALLLLVLVRVLLRPLGRVNRGMRRIARGEYGGHVTVAGGDELAELARNMNGMSQAIAANVQALEQVAEDRRIFIANLAHEMKTPLTSILGFADILRVKRSVSDRERREYAGIIVEEAKRLRSLSGKLMELITMGNGQVERVPVALRDLFEETAAALHPLLQTAGVTLQVHAPEVTVLADRELFKSLLYNLIDNAAKASAPGQVVELAAARGEDGLEITVRDHGRGIPEKDVRRVIQPFYMLDKSRTRKAGGAGLGLALCVEIARLHDTELQIESREGEGTVIRLLLAPYEGGAIDDGQA